MLIWLRLALPIAMLLVIVTTANAQAPATKAPVIGVLLPESQAAYASYVAAFRQGLRDLGYTVGQNILIEYRYAEGRRERFADLAAEIVKLKVDVIVVVGGTLAAAKRATPTIPIVVGSAGDLVGGGIVASLARPGGNITGSTNVDSDLSAKRLELLKEAFPKLSRVAVFTHEGNLGDRDEVRETRTAAERLGVRVQSYDIKDTKEFQSAFNATINERTDAMIVTNNSFNFSHRRLFFDFAAQHRLLTMCGRAAFVEDGCLVSYAAQP